ncbi:hypothetical protein [Paenibacillus crassostreae]|nr:hypothetical protein [Paenibacillus crassostreae]
MLRTACMTGADRGIGLSLVRELLQYGVTVYDGKFLRDLDALDRLKEQYP